MSGCWGLCVLLRGVCSSTLVDLALVVDRVDDDQNSDRCKDHCDGRSGDGEEVAALDVHAAHEVLLAHGSQNEGQQAGLRAIFIVKDRI